MTLEVVFTPLGLAPGDVAGRTVLVVDVLRASTTICAAMHHGARAVVVAADIEDATRIAHTLDASVLLAGERNCARIPGFQLGNSPGEMTEATVSGKTLVMTTTNGTAALMAAAGAREVVVASAVNLSAAAAVAAEALSAGRGLTIICAGRDNGFGMDDAYIAGRLAIGALGGRRTRKGLNDAALVAVDLVRRYGDNAARVFALSHAGRDLVALGFGEDVAAAARIDAHPVVPRYFERRISLTPPGRV
ncbi:MAG: 2-phosphosulfolactate phosphatase [Gemmatimonadota bacterium]